nr:unnamed protein product [Digitaria exilis]
MNVIKNDPLIPFTYVKMITVGSMVILTTYGIIVFVKFFVKLRSTLNVRDFYYNSLKVTDLEIQTISWPKVVEKVVLLQKSQQLCVVKDLSEHDIIMRLMRKENYLIGMVEHFFRHRMNNCTLHSLNYLKQFPTPLISIVAKFVSFVSGGLAGILLILGFLGESILEGHVFGRNLLWYTVVFGTVATYTITMLLEEMASIFITPYLLIFVLPKRVNDIICFISEFTVYVDGVGDVCSLSLFDFQRHGNRNYGSPLDSGKDMRSSQGKMEKSLLRDVDSSTHRDEPWEDIWPHQVTEIEEEEIWDSNLYERARSHLEASTSSAFFQRATFKRQGREQNSTSCPWWGQASGCRTDPRDSYVGPPHDSFIEPPDFANHYTSHHCSSQHSNWALNAAHPTGPEDSFHEPPNFGNNYASGYHSSYHNSDASGGTKELDERDYRSNSYWTSPQALSKTKYMENDPDLEQGLSFHFADVPQNYEVNRDKGDGHGVADICSSMPTSLHVRIVPRSSDPV